MGIMSLMTTALLEKDMDNDRRRPCSCHNVKINGFRCTLPEAEFVGVACVAIKTIISHCLVLQNHMDPGDLSPNLPPITHTSKRC